VRPHAAIGHEACGRLDTIRLMSRAAPTTKGTNAQAQPISSARLILDLRH
jgi:hypothetical protein